PQHDKEPVFAVSVTPAVSGRLMSYLEVNGDIESSSNIDVYAEKAGEVVSVNVALGQYVSEGQTIARVDPSRPGQRYVPNPVTAPISGMITSLPVRVGATVSMTSAIARISRTQDLIITTNVAERFTGLMHTGLSAEVRLEAFPEVIFTARVSEVSPVVDPVTRSMTVKLVFTGNRDGVKTGMFAEVRIITTVKNNIIKIPLQALVKRGEQQFVFVAKDAQSVEKREVVSGIEVDNKLEITKGLVAGELIVVEGQRSLGDGSKIRVIREIPGLPAEDTIGGGEK
ncbi:MAG: efflux RND transporter periplasmic adaptor subunit, partial [Spirochaetaceae bacterium]